MATAQVKPKRKSPTRWIIAAILLVIIYIQVQDQPFHLLPEENTTPAAPITELHPVVLAQKNRLVAKTRELGIKIIVTDGYRSHEEQDRLYEQGRSAPGDIVTQARGGQSMHNYGLAIDFALWNNEGQVIWDLEYDGNRNGKSDWMEVVAIAKDLGFQWGGDWASFPDYPHLQMDFGLSLRELQRGKRPPIESAPSLEALK
ncbi:M15 family metallopeptidase [Paenibacillus sp. F411]|uniref:M15 family metallopeptidase n=1 Tax=Paenibacillus sp. F411 TaxID=2820239 RepID=UPI001AAE5426|nr:M15 family metallopeptidase [Paenibacillus sp. F411]MBO2944030.1 M15 family metallopeptidase [Paenibacillus sp. F411]